MKMAKKLLTTFLALALAVTCLTAGGTEAKAATYENKYDANGLFFGTDVLNYTYEVDSNGKLTTSSTSEYVEKLRIVKSSDSYAYGYLDFDSKEDDAQLVSVKTSSKNLKAIISYKRSYNYSYSSKYSDYNSSYSDYSYDVKLLAKKAGNYKVTATIKLADGKTVTKKIPVSVVKKDPISAEVVGKKAKTNGTYDAKKVKVKITKGTGISGIKAYYATDNAAKLTDKDGSVSYFTKYKKFKSGKYIKLIAKNSYSKQYKYSNYESIYESKNFYPSTNIIIFYKDKFYGVTGRYSTYISKYKKY